MGAERLLMRQIREILRLRFASGLPQHVIARSIGLSQGSVSKYLNAASKVGLSWPLPPELDDDTRLEALLFPPPSQLPTDQRPKPDWALVHHELRRPGVTLGLLWDEYRSGAPDGFSYSWYCDLYRAWVGRLQPSMRQVHIAGEKLFVDYAGNTMEIFDGLSGEILTAQIFVAVLGASNYLLRRGDLHADTARLDRLACACFCIFCGRHAPDGDRQPSVGCDQGVFL